MLSMSSYYIENLSKGKHVYQDRLFTKNHEIYGALPEVWASKIPELTFGRSCLLQTLWAIACDTVQQAVQRVEMAGGTTFNAVSIHCDGSVMVVNIGDSATRIFTKNAAGQFSVVSVHPLHKVGTDSFQPRFIGKHSGFRAEKRADGSYYCITPGPHLNQVLTPEDLMACHRVVIDIADLAMTRSLGDIQIPLHSKISTPSFFTYTLNRTAEHVVINASDGIWDVLSNEEICRLLNEVSKEGSPKDWVQKIVRTAFSSWVLETCTLWTGATHEDRFLSAQAWFHTRGLALDKDHLDSIHAAWKKNSALFQERGTECIYIDDITLSLVLLDLKQDASRMVMGVLDGHGANGENCAKAGQDQIPQRVHWLCDSSVEKLNAPLFVSLLQFAENLPAATEAERPPALPLKHQLLQKWLTAPRADPGHAFGILQEFCILIQRPENLAFHIDLVPLFEQFDQALRPQGCFAFLKRCCPDSLYRDFQALQTEVFPPPGVVMVKNPIGQAI